LIAMRRLTMKGPQTDRASAEARELTFLESGIEALAEEMRCNEQIFILGEGIGKRGGSLGQTKGLYQEFGATRVRDTPLSELGFTGLGVGAAMAGAHPVVDLMFVDFVTEAMSQIVNQAAKICYISNGRVTVPLLIRAAMGVIRSAGAHHSQCLYPWFMHTPGLKVVVASNPYDLKGLLKTALRDTNPVISFEHKGLGRSKGPVPQDEYTIPFGKAAVRREGRDVTLVGVANMVLKALEAADKVSGEGISVEVIDPRTLVPLDKAKVLESVAKTGRLIIVEEAHRTCGAGAEIAALVAEEGFDYLDSPVRRVAAAQLPHPFSPPLENAVIPSLEDIIMAIKDVMNR
jgi:pyruvate/2-oxoglutarate/acetoin dehydrogenase E1 component